MAETFERKSSGFEIACLAFDYHLSQNAACRRRMLKAVSAESCDDKESRDGTRLADNRHRVRRHLVQSGPRVGDARIGQDRQSTDGRSSDFFQKLPTHSQTVARLLIGIRHSEKN